MFFESLLVSTGRRIYSCCFCILFVRSFIWFTFFYISSLFIFMWICLTCFLYMQIYNVSLPRHTGIQVLLMMHYVFGGNTVCYLSCWLVIGIRINPSWGLTIALFIISIFATFTYAVYLLSLIHISEPTRPY